MYIYTTKTRLIMRKILFFFFAFTMCHILNAKDTDNTQYPLSLVWKTSSNDYQTDNSLYHSISFLNSQLSKQFIIDDNIFSVQLTNILHQRIGQSTKNGQLLLQINDLYYNDKNQYIYVKATLYSIENNLYYIIDKLSSYIPITSTSENETPSILEEKISETLLNFIYQNLNKVPSKDIAYTTDDIYNIDILERDALNIPLYNSLSSGLSEGVYYTYEAFLQQEPTKLILKGKIKNNQLAEVQKADANGKYKKLPPEDVFAIVINGKAYISFDGKFRELYFNNGDLCFDVLRKSSKTGVGLSPNVGVAFGRGGGMGFGLGLDFRTKTKKEMVTYIFDYNTGRFIENDSQIVN